MHAEPEKVTKYFAGTSITAPIIGAVLSGPITNFVGGKEGIKSKKALPTCVFIAFLAVACALPVPYFTDKNDFEKVIGLLWGLLFFGAMVLPALTGIMLDSVPIS